jgi:hypothetical protein
MIRQAILQARLDAVGAQDQEVPIDQIRHSAAAAGLAPVLVRHELDARPRDRHDQPE